MIFFFLFPVPQPGGIFQTSARQTSTKFSIIHPVVIVLTEKLPNRNFHAGKEKNGGSWKKESPHGLR